ncbi:FAD-dependent oxidoreductase [Streptomyces sp. NPDC019443]|uniref:FAD-dependent oxidoreductase n=1 Tax=Streptomyces sp. NPDC019443 TaxID=3365061 RepID=UPI003788091C
MKTEFADCCIAGGGPAGVMLGYLLARQGLDVMVLEKHGDFLRDFRGDTVHPATMTIMQDLGILEQFLKLPHRRLSQVTMEVEGEEITFADFSKLRVPFPYIAFMPQWDFLSFLAEAGSVFPGFRLMKHAEVTGLITEEGQTVGVRAMTAQGSMEARARLVVAADGRRSTVRAAASLEPVAYSAPMDVLWFRLSRLPDENLAFFREGPGFALGCIDRGEYWQMGYVIPKADYEVVREEGLESMRRNISGVLPEFTERLHSEIRDWDHVSLLSVSVDRLPCWYRNGLLCIGDAAHTMSPAGGVGINLAIQDAVATSNLLGPMLVAGLTPTPADLRRVQRRRQLPTRLIQAAQVRILADLYPKKAGRPQKRKKPPAVARLARSVPAVRHLMAYGIGMGIRPERVRP